MDLYPSASDLSKETRMMHLGLMVEEILLIYFGFVVLGVFPGSRWEGP